MRKSSLLFYIILFTFLCFAFTFADEIHSAIEKGDLQAVQTLLDKDISFLKSLDENKYTPLHLTCEKGHLEIAEYLLKKGADINAKNYQENTPLHLAAEKGHFEIVQLLVLKGADVNIKNFRARVPAFRALVYRSKSEIIKYLINHGTDINTRDRNGSSLLVRACERRFPEVVDLLLDKKVELPSKQNEVVQLIHYAAFIDHTRLFNLLLEKNPEINLKESGDALLRLSAQNGSADTLKLLIEKNFNPGAPNIYGNSAIHLAAKGGYKGVVKILLDNGVDINTVNAVGKTALHIAEEYGKQQVAEYLINKEAKQGPADFPKLTGLYIGQKTPGEKPEVFAPGIVSIEILEHSPPVFSKDGTEVYWATEELTKIVQMKLVDGQWTPPTVMAFNSEYGDSEPAFSSDNNKLFFLSQRSKDGKSKSNREMIWYVERVAKGWSDPKLISDDANSYPLHWTISVDEEESIYFTSGHGSGHGAQDIYKTELKNGVYQKPVNLGPVINSQLTEHTPYIAPDQSYLIFAVSGHPEGHGRMDLFVSFKNENGQWIKPQNLGPTINTSGLELCPVVTPDGKYLFYLGGINDIYWVSTKIIDRLKPKKIN